MNITIKTITPKLTISLLKQIQEATTAEMQYAVDNGTVLGYINVAGTMKTRVFLISVEDNYRTVVNRQWVLSGEGTTLTAKGQNKNFWQKKFSTRESAKHWLDLFSIIKTAALRTQIYI